MRGVLLLPMLLAMACGGSTPPSTAPDTRPPVNTAPPIRVLMLTATLGFRHDSIPTARQVMSELASRSGSFTVTATEALSEVTAARLSATDVLMFALTTGELPFDTAQES